jgi:hypothetical protein
MLATFSDFIRQNPNCKKFESSEIMQEIFDFLSKDFIIIQMIDMSEAGKPALTPVARNIENFFINYGQALDNFTKQAVGVMVKTILEPFGYNAYKQKNLPKSADSENFQTASVYRRDRLKVPTMRVVKRIEEI